MPDLAFLPPIITDWPPPWAGHPQRPWIPVRSDSANPGTTGQPAGFILSEMY